MKSNQAKKEILALAEHLDLSDGKDLMLELMRRQKRIFQDIDTEYEPDRDNCTLIDMYSMQIVGSGICGKCFGFLGRADGYTDD